MRIFSYFCFLFLSSFFILSHSVWASFFYNPRLEYARRLDKNQVLTQKALIKTKIDKKDNKIGFYFEGFAEIETDEEQQRSRLTQDSLYIQEVYIEYKSLSWFSKFGVQAMRWSEMWTLPSLDIFTGRRWNRLFLDPVTEQLTHSTGLSLAYVKKNWSLESFYIFQNANSYFPKNIPIAPDSKLSEPGVGLRFKKDLKRVSWGIIAAQVRNDKIIGTQMNYATDYFVPKWEVAGRWKEKVKPNIFLGQTIKQMEADYNRERLFTSFGSDIFLGNWLLTPQVTLYNFEEKGPDLGEYDLTYYLGLSWSKGKHSIQFYGTSDKKSHDEFGSLTYSYNLSRNLTLSTYLQHYKAQKGTTINSLMAEIAGENLVGFRLDFTGEKAF